VVGVAANVPMHGLSNDRSEPLLYLPFRGSEAGMSWAVAVRTAPGADPTAAVRAIVRSLDTKLPPPPVRSVARALEETISSQRFAMTLLGMFAALALVLSAVGLYGVISFVVTQRTREIGIRVALGATSAQIARAVVARGFVLSAAGVVVGLVAAVWAARLIANVLYGVQPVDPVSYGSTAGVLLGISLVACLVPMRRAIAIDPAITMRAE
jgi:ABC-type antimicrobial peptide transport system permease subunit